MKVRQPTGLEFVVGVLFVRLFWWLDTLRYRSGGDEGR